LAELYVPVKSLVNLRKFSRQRAPKFFDEHLRTANGSAPFHLTSGISSSTNYSPVRASRAKQEVDILVDNLVYKIFIKENEKTNPQPAISKTWWIRLFSI
jgi:hypothetical protein